MKRFRKFLLRTCITLAVLYLLLCTALYFFQESFIFHPGKIPQEYTFNYEGKFREMLITAPDGKKLHGLLFTQDSSEGIVFYLHGNAGALDSWGNVAETYLQMNYDCFILDYRGYGKSDGEISGEEEFYSDVLTAYDSVRRIYSEEKIIVIGYSIGSGAAAMVASKNNPRLLVLQAPYYSLVDMMRQQFPIVPAFLLKYRFETHSFMEKTKCPVVIFHGTEDQVIYYGSSEKLKMHFKKEDALITLEGEDHFGLNENPDYSSRLVWFMGKNLHH